MKKLMVLFFLVFPVQMFLAQSVTEQFKAANDLYENKQYSGALNLLKKIEKQDYGSPDFFLNLGNTYFRLDSIPQSILNYERGLLLNPNDKELIHSRDFARSTLAYKAGTYPLIFYKQWLKNVIVKMGSFMWLLFSVVLIWLAFYLLYQFVKDRKQKYFFPAILMGLCSLLFLVFSGVKYYWETKDDMAIIFNKTVSVKTAPSLDAQSQFKLSPGNKVRIADSLEDWTQIALEDGKEGWVKSENLVLIQ